MKKPLTIKKIELKEKKYIPDIINNSISLVLFTFLSAGILVFLIVFFGVLYLVTQKKFLKKYKTNLFNFLNINNALT